MGTKRLFVDMDGTLARFHDQVNYLERMFEKDFFRELDPFENMVEGIRQFKQMHPDVEVYILSAKVNGEPPYCEEEKHAWMNIHLPEIPESNRIFTEMGRPKAEFIPGGITKDDFLLDDYNKGLNQFMYDGGRCIKCHNNINQKGLGAHGGQRGNLWVGAMVHISDKPEMIAAELSKHMGLEYDFNRVVGAYPEIMKYFEKELEVSDKYESANPLDEIRYLSGLEDFKEISLPSDEEFRVPVHILRSICCNLYSDPDYQHFLQTDAFQFAEDVKYELEQAEKPIIGHIDYMVYTGEVGERVNFYDAKEMQDEINACKECSQPIRAHWNVTIQKAPEKLRSLSSIIETAENTSKSASYVNGKVPDPGER